MRIVLLLFSCSALCLFACNSDPEDPLATKCAETCKVEPGSVCASMETQCVADCKAWSAQVQIEYGTPCAECVAGTIEYSTKPDCTSGPDCCWGALEPKRPTHPEFDQMCLAICFEPDGGVGF